MNQETNSNVKTENESKYMRVREVACEMARSVRQVWRDAGAGKIPKPFKHGGSTYWVRAEILAFMRELQQNRSH